MCAACPDMTNGGPSLASTGSCVAITGWTHTLVRILGLGYFPCPFAAGQRQLSLTPERRPRRRPIRCRLLQPFDKVLDEHAEFPRDLFTSLIFFTQTPGRHRRTSSIPMTWESASTSAMIFAAWEELKRLAAEGGAMALSSMRDWSSSGTEPASPDGDLRPHSPLYPQAFRCTWATRGSAGKNSARSSRQAPRSGCTPDCPGGSDRPRGPSRRLPRRANTATHLQAAYVAGPQSSGSEDFAPDEARLPRHTASDARGFDDYAGTRRVPQLRATASTQQSYWRFSKTGGPRGAGLSQRQPNR